jgi:diguanylate cyclase (GGDEF)-like protein/PAS domain S-box-containing protein
VSERTQQRWLPDLRRSVGEAARRANTVEEALRGALSTICSHTGWHAARAQFSSEAGDLASRIVWHLEAPDRLPSLRTLAESRRHGAGAELVQRVLAQGAPAFRLAEGGLAPPTSASATATATFVFPALLRKRTLAALEFFSDHADALPERQLDNVAMACADLGELIERKPAEESLRRAERDYRDLFESAGEALLVLDAELRTVLDANPRACELCGWSWPELVASDLRSLWTGVPGSLASGGSGRFETMHRRHGGAELRLEVTVSPVRWRGRPAALALAREVPERERVLEALRASADRDRQLFEKSPQPMWVHDAQTFRFLAVNDAALRLYGHERHVFLKLSVSDLLAVPGRAPQDPAQDLPFEPAWAAAVQRHRVASGEAREMELSSHDIFYEGKRARLVAVADVTRRREAQARLLHAAFYDPLTGLPNRALFRERLELAHARTRRTPGAPFAVLFLDLDRFKLVNDSLGHEAGDELLVQVARRLESCRRKGDTVARLGGDEFTVLVESANGETEAIQVADRVHRSLLSPFRVRGHDVFARMSIGIALGGGETDRPETVLREADTAMYRAKVLGLRHAVFDRSMQEHALAALRTETELRRAAERQELLLHFQPIVELPGRKLLGVEALLRWQHRERGLLLPAEFLPLAEETGIVQDLGRWALEEACAQARALPPEVTLYVNLSGQELLQPGFVDQVRGALDRTSFPASRLLLELTESTLIETGPAGAGRLAELRSLGGRLCIDDFGTGYSSLSYLHQLPIDALKIDASFVRALPGDVRRVAIVQSILLLGRGLGIEVVAEGVETTAQAELLASLGCTRAQGYLFSRPMPLGALLAGP